MIESVCVSLAGHIFRISGSDEISLMKAIPGFPLFFVETNQDPEWQITFGVDIPEPQHWVELYNYTFETGDMVSRFGKSDDDFYYRMDFSDVSKSSLLLSYSGGNVVYANHCSDASALRFVLWMAVGMLSASRKMVLIHSSVIVHQNRAVLFLGESGTGKSTHTRLWLKNIPDAHLLNDDSPILVIEDGTPVVYGSPWSGKTHCYHQKHFPLAAVVRLSQAPYNKIRRLGIVEAFSQIQPSCPPALAQDDVFADSIVSMLGDVISAVPVFHLECLPDADAAQTSYKAIFG